MSANLDNMQVHMAAHLLSWWVLLPFHINTLLANNGYGYGVMRATCGCHAKASDNTRAVGQEAGGRLPAEQARRVILCSGQIYYRLFHARRARQIRDIILVRLEQIAPFPHDLVTQVPPCLYSSTLLWRQTMLASVSCLEASVVINLW